MYETSFSFKNSLLIKHSGLGRDRIGAVFRYPNPTESRGEAKRAANENVTQKWIWKPPVALVNYKSKR